MKERQRIQVVTSSDEDKFTERVNNYLSEGWKIESTNCGFVNSEKYDFCNVFQAILMKVTLI